jgi:hypothetical protein
MLAAMSMLWATPHNTLAMFGAQVSTALSAAQLPLMDDAVTAVFPRCKAVNALPTRSSDNTAGGGSIAVHAPLLEWDDNNCCAGRMLW